MKKFNLGTLIAGLVLSFGLLTSTAPIAAAATDGSVANGAPSQARLAKEVRHKLLMLPYYGVFDNLQYSINGSRVTLLGQVVRPTTRSDAARSVAGIEGVTQVVNKIEVLPLSPFDDSIRARTYRALSRAGGLNRYFAGANPSVHIIVNRGQLTLTGVVDSSLDKQLAYMTARGVSGVFSVTNELQLGNEREAR